jgi:lysophospholipase L1-like esterase
MTKTKTSKRWGAFDAWSVTNLLILVGLIEIWSLISHDDDFYFPNPFSILILIVMVIFLLTALIPRGWLRLQLRFFLIVLPVIGVLIIECSSMSRDLELINERIQLSEDTLLRYHYRPGIDTSSGTINSHGLWDKEHTIEKPAGVFRIVVLGDSVPNDGSIPFEKRFHQLLEKQLAPKVEIINVSCEGYNSIQEVRLLEKVGLKFKPDMVVLTYVLNDPFIQNGGYRRLGNSFFLFKLKTLFDFFSDSKCEIFVPLHDRYAFDLVVRTAFERLALLSQLHDFPVLVAILPIVERFDDPLCLSLYDQVHALAKEVGFEAIRVVDAFAGLDHKKFIKPKSPDDITHPNQLGHQKIAETLAAAIRPILDSQEPSSD